MSKTKKALLWIVGSILSAIIGWLVVSLLDGAFTPLTEAEIIQIMRDVQR